MHDPCAMHHCDVERPDKLDAQPAYRFPPVLLDQIKDIGGPAGSDGQP